MADHTADPRFESLLREALTAEVAKLPLTVRPDRILERAATRRASGGSRLRVLTSRQPDGGLWTLSIGVAAAASLVVAAVVAVSLPRTVDSPAAPLPTSPDAWSRVLIEDTSDVNSVASLVAGPRGLLAAAGEGEESRLWFSADGGGWTRVPADEHPAIGTNGAALVATDQGFLMVGTKVLASDDGLSWQLIADPTTDPDLRLGTPIAAAAGGPGVVAVGTDNQAWYSTDGSDWSLADVPPPPGEPSQLARPLDPTQPQGIVEMLGVAASARELVAWGTSNWVHDDGTSTFMPVLWTSSDGRSWTNVPPPQPTRYATVAGGPDGFVMQDGGAVWLSSDGRSWERVPGDAFGPSRWPELQNDEGNRVQMLVGPIAAGPSGYVAVGTDGVCLLPCSSAEAVIWTSPDGRSWSRLPNDDLFRAPNGARAGVVAAWGSRFIVGGASDRQPAIWISGTPPTPTASPTPSPAELPADGTVVGPGRYSISVDGYRYTFGVPSAGWRADVVTAAQAETDHPYVADVELTFGDSNHTPSNLAGFGLWGNATQVHRARCQELMGASNDVGPTADDLATAIASLDGFTSSGPTDVTVGRYTGKRLRLAVPTDRWAACTNGAYRYAYGSFTDEDDKDREYQGPEQIDDIWILDLEKGHRQLFLITYFPNTPTERVEELRQMIESLEIEPVDGSPAAGGPRPSADAAAGD